MAIIAEMRFTVTRGACRVVHIFTVALSRISGSVYALHYSLIINYDIFVLQKNSFLYRLNCMSDIMLISSLFLVNFYLKYVT